MINGYREPRKQTQHAEQSIRKKVSGVRSLAHRSKLIAHSQEDRSWEARKQDAIKLLSFQASQPSSYFTDT
jgi:hypothetical protein